MSAHDSRKALFNNIILSIGGNKKEWEKLTMLSVGLSKYENLLSQYSINDNIWNIVIDYVQIAFPKYRKCKYSYPKYHLDTDDIYCDICEKIYGWLIMVYSTYSPETGNARYYSIICDSCIIKNITGVRRKKDNIAKMIKLIVCDVSGTYSNNKLCYISDILPQTYSGILKWLGYGDFQSIRQVKYQHSLQESWLYSILKKDV